MLVRPVRRTSSACRVGIVPSKICLKSPGEVFTEELGGAVQPASQNPYPIYDQDLRYSLPFYDETLFMTWLLNQNPVSDQRYNKFRSSNQC